jgi:dipeptidyl aminopeptidase/acylaminoacyl peptidase
MRHPVSVLLASLVISSAGPALRAQEDRRPIVAEDLYRLQFASGVAVSPDGRWVAYVISRADSASNTYRADLWLAAADGSERRRLTWTETATESQPVFSPDGRHLAFVSRREDDERSQIYLLPLAEGGEARPVTNLEAGAFNPVWSPNGQRIAFFSRIEPGSGVESARDSASPQDRPFTMREKLERNAANADPVVITRLNYLGLSSIREERWNQIFVIDVFADGAEPVQITAGPFPHSGLSWTADSRLILYGATPPKGDYHADYELDSDIMRIAAAAHSMHDVLTGGDPSDPRILEESMASRANIPRPDAHSDFAATYSPDGRRIAYMRRSLDRHMAARNTELVVMSADGTDEYCVSCELDRSVRSYDWDSDGRLYFTAGDEGVVPLYRTRPDGTQAEKFVGGPRGVLSFDVGGGTIAWVEMNPTDPSEVHVAGLTGEDERRITELNDHFLDTVHVQPYEEMWYRAPDGALVQGWVIRPPNFVAGAHPLAVEMHGGPHVMWGPGEQTMWHEYQILAGAGYVVFLSNPRGSDGYGFEWKRAIHRNWGDLPAADVLAGADSVLRRGWADPERQTITGGSSAIAIVSPQLWHNEVCTTCSRGTEGRLRGGSTKASLPSSHGRTPCWRGRRHRSHTSRTSPHRSSSCIPRRITPRPSPTRKSYSVR